MLQSKNKIKNTQYLAQMRVLAKVDAGEIALADILADSAKMVAEERV
jgi:hypothetical protein